MTTELFEDYSIFVNGLLSKPSSDFDAMIERLQELRTLGCDVPRLLTASNGLCSESGEFQEIIKKFCWQGKPYNDDNILHMKKELSDIVFYLMTACLALNIGLDDIIEENIRKLESRYPGGKFDVQHSEVRKIGDL